MVGASRDQLSLVLWIGVQPLSALGDHATVSASRGWVAQTLEPGFKRLLPPSPAKESGGYITRVGCMQVRAAHLRELNPYRYRIGFDSIQHQSNAGGHNLAFTARPLRNTNCTWLRVQFEDPQLYRERLQCIHYCSPNEPVRWCCELYAQL